jgi:hypothetical protein
VDQTSIINRLNPELFQLCCSTTYQDGWTEDTYVEMMEVRLGVLMLLMRRLELVHRNPMASGGCIAAAPAPAAEGSNCSAGVSCGFCGAKSVSVRIKIHCRSWTRLLAFCIDGAMVNNMQFCTTRILYLGKGNWRVHSCQRQSVESQTTEPSGAAAIEGWRL